MQQVRIHAASDVRVDEVEEPEPGPRDAIVRVVACGICGTDLTFVRYGALSGSGGPMPLGHEISGVVERVGADVDWRVGDRVVVRPGDDELGRIGNGTEEGGLAPRLLVREADRRLHEVPQELDLVVAALTEPVAVAMNAVDQADVRPGEAVVVLGCGPIGLGAVAVLADRGVTRVVAVDPSARRRALALELGAELAVDPTTDDVWATLRAHYGTVSTLAGETNGADAYIESSGVGSLITDVVTHARPGARLSVVALHQQDVPVSMLLVMMKQLTIRGAMEYPARFEDAVDLLTRRDLSALVTDRFPLDRFGEALALLQGSKECGKVMITFGGGAQ